METSVSAQDKEAHQRPKVIVGLGNPGPQYVFTRHNIGFWVISAVHDITEIETETQTAFGIVSEATLEKHPVFLVKPMLFMNRSGIALTHLMYRYEWQVEDLLVIYDDLDLAEGRIRIRPAGGPGGHNGMRSIIEALGTKDFARIRMGIGRPPGGMEPADFVLEPVDEDTEASLLLAINNAVKAIRTILTDGLEIAMNTYNKQT